MKLKNNLILFFSAFLAISPIMPAYSFAQTALFDAKVTADALIVRSGAGKGYKNIGRLYAGDKVQVYEEKNGWDRISSAEKWVMDEYLKKTTTTSQAVSQNVSIAVGTLIVRSGPGKKYARVSDLKKGDVVKIYASKNGWYKVAESEKWIMSSFVKKASASAEAMNLDEEVASAVADAAVGVVENSSALMIAPPTEAPVSQKPTSTKLTSSCLQAIASANKFCKKIAKGCSSYSTTSHCVSANEQCEARQQDALAECPQQ